MLITEHPGSRSARALPVTRLAFNSSLLRYAEGTKDQWERGRRRLAWNWGLSAISLHTAA